ncbi:hypothetical protein D3C84_1072910 [compost metagenome]
MVALIIVVDQRPYLRVRHIQPTGHLHNRRTAQDGVEHRFELTHDLRSKVADSRSGLKTRYNRAVFSYFRGLA